MHKPIRPADDRPSPDSAQILAAAMRLFAQSSEAMALGRRFQDAGMAMLAEVGACADLSAGAAGLARLASFRAACRERSHRVTGDGYVGEAAAADLLAVARTTLATWRQEGRLQYRRTPGGHIQYSLAALAEFVGGFATD